tara:strand:+ start:1307 stop:1708 length:402 start_codon:yes stop_codon:yes gene_type:complete
VNLTRSALMDDVAAASLTADIDGLLTLGALPVAVSFSTPTGATTINLATGAVSRTLDTDTITGWRAALSVKEVGNVDGAKSGDAWLLIMQADVSTVPTLDSFATIAGARHKVVSPVEIPPLSSHYKMRVRVHA